MQEPGDKRGKMAFNLLKGDVLARTWKACDKFTRLRNIDPKSIVQSHSIQISLVSRQIQ